MLADWTRRTGRAVAWLSVDAGDNDPARFWRHVLTALDPLRPGLADLTSRMPGGASPGSFEGVVAALINELAVTSDELVLVLDDYDVIDAAAVHASVVFLVEHRPPALHLVLACRADPLLPLALPERPSDRAVLRARRGLGLVLRRRGLDQARAGCGSPPRRSRVAPNTAVCGGTLLGHPTLMRCEIRVEGILDERWSSWFDGLDIRSDGEHVTVISGTVADQAALHGLLSRIHDLGLALISVRRVEDDRSRGS
jgi:hypothetical protein